MPVLGSIRKYKKQGPGNPRGFFVTMGGLYQNITFAVHPDPISGVHLLASKS